MHSVSVLDCRDGPEHPRPGLRNARSHWDAKDEVHSAKGDGFIIRRLRLAVTLSLKDHGMLRSDVRI
jgi:hypothetical protein